MTTVCVDTDDFTTDTNGKLQIKKGCGIKGTSDGIAADVAQTWPFDGDVADGSNIYCDPDTGRLKGPPRDKVLLVENASTDGDTPSVLSTAGDTECHILQEFIDLSAWVENAAASITIGAQWTVNQLANADWTVRIEESLNGDPFAAVFSGVGGGSGGPAQVVNGSFSGPRVFPLNNGAAPHNYRVRVCIESNSAINLTVTRLRVFLAGMVVTAN